MLAGHGKWGQAVSKQSQSQITTAPPHLDKGNGPTLLCLWAHMANHKTVGAAAAEHGRHHPTLAGARQESADPMWGLHTQPSTLPAPVRQTMSLRAPPSHLNRPSVMSAQSLPRPAPMIALVGVSISGMPGPPLGPSYRITTTEP